jgi:Uma2 family endonuclease
MKAGAYPRLWTRREFYAMAEAGFFRGQKAELIGGIVMVSSPQSAKHANTLLRTYRLLEKILGEKYCVRPQFPMAFEADAEPEPDISVVEGNIDDFDNEHPTQALLVVEISRSTLKYDQTEKASLYASRGVSEYWIVNLIKRRLEVRRGPIVDADEPWGWTYSSLRLVGENDSVEPLAAPGKAILVRDLLPPAPPRAK